MSHIETYSVCLDCYLVEGTGDATALDYHYGDKADDRLAEIEAGYSRLTVSGGYLIAGDDISDFSNHPCECCGSPLAGSRHELHVHSSTKKG